MKVYFRYNQPLPSIQFIDTMESAKLQSYLIYTLKKKVLYCETHKTGNTINIYGMLLCCQK